MREARRAEVIIDEELARVRGAGSSRWRSCRRSPRSARRPRRSAQAELEKALKRLGGLSEKELTTVEALTEAIVNKMLHGPTARLKAVAGEKDGVRVRRGRPLPVRARRDRGARRTRARPARASSAWREKPREGRRRERTLAAERTKLDDRHAAAASSRCGRANYIKDKLEALTGLPVEPQDHQDDRRQDPRRAAGQGRRQGAVHQGDRGRAGRRHRRPRRALDEGRARPSCPRASSSPRCPSASTRATRSSPARATTSTRCRRARSVGTSSLRRVRAGARACAPTSSIVDVRGNLDTRMRKAENGELDAVILASAGITRMGWADRITHYIDPDADGLGRRPGRDRHRDPRGRRVHGATSCAKIARPRDDGVRRRPSASSCARSRAAARCRSARRARRGRQAAHGRRRRQHRRHDDRAPQPRGRRRAPEALGAAMVDRLLELGAGEILADVRAAAEADIGVDGLIET